LGSAIHRIPIGKRHCLFAFIFISVQAFSQTWSEPVIINYGISILPDFVVDSEGTIHCVWIEYLGNHYSKIYYSKSTNSGNSWSISVPITKNESRRIYYPHIVVDSKNNLFVSYDYDVDGWPKIAYVKFDSELDTWSEQFILDYGEYNAISVDHSDRVFFFWTKETTYYRVLVGDSLSDILRPYSKDTILCSFQSIGVDSENGLHIIGTRKHNFHLHTAYFVFKDGSWRTSVDISDMGAVQSSIEILENNQPSFFWTQPLLDSLYNIGSFLATFDGDTLTPLTFVDTIATGPTHFYSENNHLHLVEGIKHNGLFFLVDKQKNEIEFDCDTIESNAFAYNRNVCHKNDSNSYLIYHKVDTSWSSLPNSHNSSIIFRKMNLVNGTTDLTKKNKINIFPNPFSESINIEFPSQLENVKSIKIFDLSGNSMGNLKAISSHNWDQGYSITCSKEDIKKMPKGFYIIKIELHSKIFTSLIIHN